MTDASSWGSKRSGTTSSTPRWTTSRAFDPNQRCSTTYASSCCSSSCGSSPRTSASRTSAVIVVVLLLFHQPEPVEAAGSEREQVGQLADAREAAAAEHLLGVAPHELREVELDRLRGAGQVVHAEQHLALVAAQVG